MLKTVETNRKTINAMQEDEDLTFRVEYVNGEFEGLRVFQSGQGFDPDAGVLFSYKNGIQSLVDLCRNLGLVQ